MADIKTRPRGPRLFVPNFRQSSGSFGLLRGVATLLTFAGQATEMSNTLPTKSIQNLRQTRSVGVNAGRSSILRGHRGSGPTGQSVLDTLPYFLSSAIASSNAASTTACEKFAGTGLPCSLLKAVPSTKSFHLVVLSLFLLLSFRRRPLMTEELDSDSTL